MKDCSGRILVSIFFIMVYLVPFEILAQDNSDEVIHVPLQKSELSIDNLRGRTIKEISTAKTFGVIIDMYMPSKLLPFYIFVFKQEKIVFHIAAIAFNYDDLNSCWKKHLDNFEALYCYAIYYPDGKIDSIFNNPVNITLFDKLNNINPKSYTSISDIENILNINFTEIETSGFLYPFYEYYCILPNNMILIVLGTPSEQKELSYFVGRWRYIQKE